MKTHNIKHIADLLKLDSSEFERMLPDLRAWCEFGKLINHPDVEVVGFDWVDDNKPGEIHSVGVTVKETGERFEFEFVAQKETE